MGSIRWIAFRVARVPGIRVVGLITIAAAVAAVVMSLPPMPQAPSYHQFADRRGFLGVPNFLNVVSNAVYALVGEAGMWVLMRRSAAGQPGGGNGDRHRSGESRLAGTASEPVPVSASRLGWADRLTFGTLFVGVLATTFGSAWYHLDPCNATLVWDRLPMTVAFMGLACGLVTERINAKAGALLLAPMAAAGIASVLYWYAGEQHGAGDMRPYILVQGLPLLMVPYVAVAWPGRYLPRRDLLIAVGWYVLAKVLELGDGAVFALGGVVSGHTLKHLAAAAGVYWIARAIRRNAGDADGVTQSGSHGTS
jgi:hypothetical protein